MTGHSDRQMVVLTYAAIGDGLIWSSILNDTQVPGFTTVSMICHHESLLHHSNWQAILPPCSVLACLHTMAI